MISEVLEVLDHELVPKWILFYLKCFGLHLTNGRSKMYVCYQLFLVVIAFANWVYLFFDESFDFDSKTITGIMSHLESKKRYW